MSAVMADLGFRTALFIHRSGALAAWQGAGDEQLLRAYSAAAGSRDRDLQDLLRDAIYPSAELGGVWMWPIRDTWQVELAWPFEIVYEKIDVLAKDRQRKWNEDPRNERLMQLVRDLEQALPDSAAGTVAPAAESAAVQD